MRILLLGHDFATSGGVGKYLNQLVHGLVAAGHEVGAIQSLAVDTGRWPDGAQRWTVPLFDAFDPGVRPHATEAVLELVDRMHPAVVHVHDGSNFELEREVRRRVPAVKTLHTLDFCPTGLRYHYTTRRLCTHRVGWACLPRIGYKRCALSKRPWVWWRMVRRSLASRAHTRGYGAVIVTSEYVRRFVINQGLGDAQVHVVPYFAAAPAEVTPLPKAPRILFAARVYPEKGLDLMLRAVARLDRRDVGIDVVGDGPAVAPARSLAERLGLSSAIEFHGWQRDVEPFYRRTSLLVVPSRLAEPFGIVGIEAMAHARPVVAFAVGGIPDWLQDGVNGFLVPPEDVEEMAWRIGELVDHPDRCRSLGLAGRSIAQARYTIRVHLERLVGLYRQVARA